MEEWISSHLPEEFINFAKQLYKILINGGLIAALLPPFIKIMFQKQPLAKERYIQVFCPIIRILEEIDFQYSPYNDCNGAIANIKQIILNNRALAGEKLYQYLYKFDNAATPKKKKKEFYKICNYIICEFNRLAKQLKLPKISFLTRLSRKWYNTLSIGFYATVAIQTAAIFLPIYLISLLIIIGLIYATKIS